MFNKDLKLQVVDQRKAIETLEETIRDLRTERDELRAEKSEFNKVDEGSALKQLEEKVDQQYKNQMAMTRVLQAYTEFMSQYLYLAINEDKIPNDQMYDMYKKIATSMHAMTRVSLALGEKSDVLETLKDLDDEYNKRKEEPQYGDIKALIDELEE